MSVIIEYCIGCRSHQWNTRHDESRYFNLYKEFEERFKNLGFKVVSIKIPRLGSFEISLGEYNLFSKLDSGQFPNVDSVVRIV